MPRESLGQFRIYKFTCDICQKEQEHSVRGSKSPIPPPPGWATLRVAVNDKYPLTDAIVCSVTCATTFVQRLVEPEQEADA